LGVACINSIYKDPRYCFVDGDCKQGLCNRGVCMPVDGGVDMTPQACLKFSDCTSADQAICDLAAGRCRPCASDSECAQWDTHRPYCANQVCVQCRSHTDCIAAGGSCKGGSCVPCALDTDCASFRCMVPMGATTGACDDPKNYVYVKSGSTCPGSGTVAAPYCAGEVTQGFIDASGSMNHALIVEPGSDYAAVTLNPSMPMTVNAIGVGSPTLASLTVSNGGTMINLGLTGFVFSGSAGDGVSCSSSVAADQTALTLSQVKLENNPGYGLNSLKCHVEVDRAKVERNSLGGLFFTASNFRVMNAVVYLNGTNGPSSTGGLYMSGTNSRALVINSSFALNQVMAGAGPAAGITCTAGAVVLNVALHGDVVEEVNTVCNVGNSAFVGASTVPNGMGNRDLVGCPGSPYAGEMNDNLQPSSQASGYCSLVGGGAQTYLGAQAPSYDVDGNPRPLGSAFDIGAYESK
jgi:hypothetical protein